MGFLNILGEAEIQTWRKLEKVDFHSTGKVWENTNITNLWVSQIFWVKQIH